jgi:chromosome segregation ATPase
VLRIGGPHAATIQKVIPEAYVADTFDQAMAMSRETSAPVATIDGDVFRGPHLVSGGAKVESRGILATKREIKELRERVAGDRSDLLRLAEEVAALDVAIARAASAIAELNAEQHRLEKDIVGYDAQLGRVGEDTARLTRKADVIALERRQAEEERVALDARTQEAQQSIERLQDDQRIADGGLSDAQRRLLDAKETAEYIAGRIRVAGGNSVMVFTRQAVDRIFER